jgi:hypothetical protein
MTALHRTAARTLSAAVLTAAALLGTTGIASADETPRIGVVGEEMWLTGDNSGCSGAVHVGIQNNPAVPGRVTVTLTSRGMNAVGPEWDRNPICRNVVRFGWYDAIAPFSHEVAIPVAFGRGPEAPLRTDVVTGSGLNLFSITANLSKGVSYYVAIP